jgi:acyl-CoA hydrolase
MPIYLDDIAALDLSAFVRLGDQVVWGQGCGEPQTLIEALIEQAPDLEGISTFVASSFSGLLTAEAGRRMKVHTMGAIGQLREIASAGLLNVVPCHVGQIGPMIADGTIACDVAFVQVSPAGEDGKHSFGLSNDYVRQAVEKARVVVAEVNDRVPFTLGDMMLPTAEIDFLLQTSRAPTQLQSAEISETDLAIARHATAFIGDGAVIQTGVGGAPDAMLRLLKDRRDLGVHSGMIGDGLVDLVEAGVVTNARKPFDTGVSVAGLLLGTQRLYDWAHRNPLLAMRGADYTHGEPVLTRIPNLVTINSAIEVDLTGFVNAEASGAAYLGGTGGQVDYVRAGSRARGGRSIIALPSTAKGGTISRIVSRLNGPVTTARSEVDVIVTEFGSAELKGQPIAERVRRMIAIAHPDFQEDLDRAAHEVTKRGY